MFKQDKPLYMIDTTLGMDNRNPSHAVADKSVRRVTNLDILPTGEMVTRKTPELLCNTSALSIYATRDGRLFAQTPGGLAHIINGQADILDAALEFNTPCCFAEYNGMLWYSGMGSRGRVLLERRVTCGGMKPALTTLTNWGPPRPGISIEQTTGDLRPGNYLVGVTSQDDFDVESDAEVRQVAMQEGAFIIHLAPNGYRKRIYLSHVNGETMHHQITLPDGAIDFEVFNVPKSGGTPLMDSLFPVPHGSKFIIHRAQLFSVAGNTCYISEPYNLHLANLLKSYSFEAPITMLTAVEGGVMLAADKLYLITNDIKCIALDEVLPVAGTELAYAHNAKGKQAYWLTERGAALVDAEGRVSYPAKDRIRLKATSGISAHIKQREQDVFVTFADTYQAYRDTPVTNLIDNGVN